MPIDFEKLLRSDGFSNKKVVDNNEEKKLAFLPKEDVEVKTDKSKSKKKSKKANPQPNLKTEIEDETKLSVRMIIETKPPKKTIIEYIKSKIEMFEDSDSDSD
jgi:hypothetical protein